jgi:hypothetical protein
MKRWSLWKIGSAIFFYYPFASGGVVGFLIVLYPSMQLSMHGEETFWNGRSEIKARASHFVTPNSFSFWLQGHPRYWMSESWIHFGTHPPAFHLETQKNQELNGMIHLTPVSMATNYDEMTNNWRQHIALIKVLTYIRMHDLEMEKNSKRNW